MSATKKLLSKKQKLKQMSKMQIQLSIIKKKQCDAKALAIVEQLLEPNVSIDWLLQNLGFISKSHMEDVIEERAIVKLCGYVLCSKPLTVIIQQQYHISTRKNKVYDVSKRKNFCSSSCYGAANYLLEQMLESPLWLREKDDIPVFQILPINLRSTQIIPGDEIDVSGINLVQNKNADGIEDNKESVEHSTAKYMKQDISNSKEKDIHNDTITKNNVELEEISINIDSDRLFNNKTHSSEQSEKEENKTCDNQESINHKNSDNIQKINANLKNLEIEDQSKGILYEDNTDAKNKNTNASIMCNIENSKMLQSRSDKLENNQNNSSKLLQSQFNKITDDQNTDKKSQLEGINNENKNKKLDNIEGVTQPQLDEMCSSNATSSVSGKKIGKKRDANRSIKNKCLTQKESDNAEMQANIYHKVAMRIEQSVKEWITENTLCLLLGEEDEKYQLLESLTRHDRYQQLCKKLNRLQLEDEKEDRVNLEKNVLKPLPHFSVIQEEAKKIELKVRAFYEGQVTITPSEDSNKDSENKDDSDLILPLTDSHAPNALRRRIFLDKVNKILPDLLRALTADTSASLIAQCTYNNERYSLTKILISTFNLTAANIVFKTAEWTLVGLIIIKMLSLIDTQLQSLLRSKQATMYTSMILMSYKLDSNYLDRLIMEVTNNMDACDVNNK
ncbi:putative RNA polymerase II subunit B1 CTD phosphatase RPAP2 [Linepithema humile]|uniref:putative RNA polymerase II subunit B1 CTD phosphatase RPAP2 n=1 Tax=Linepithema humile TaxID=83485 RepID=UPI00062395D7|nr:PREDICTED: putative RNA polymerase II subunit B1 CTD phosphatase RPAP2 [Linepithema humile]